MLNLNCCLIGGQDHEGTLVHQGQDCRPSKVFPFTTYKYTGPKSQV